MKMQLEDAAAVLNVLCPMHVILSGDGTVLHSGATLQKLCHGKTLDGSQFFKVFDLRRPRDIRSIADLRRAAGQKLHLQLREAPHTGLKGVAVPWAHGAVVNLSFGISILDAVRDHALTSADFAATDMTVEMLYLVEAKSAAMEASRKLNQRLQGARIAAEEQAFTDTLTGLKNRRALAHVLRRLSSGPTGFALMHLDLDFFKAVNDTLGHPAGDHVLQEVARILVEETRESDTVSRVGGDEFVLVLPGRTEPDRLDAIAHRIITRLQQPIPFEGQVCRISGSIGTSLSDHYDPPDPDRMMADADLALYASKRQGRARHSFFKPGDRAGAT